jgi:hypothetical protein
MVVCYVGYLLMRAPRFASSYAGEMGEDLMKARAAMIAV